MRFLGLLLVVLIACGAPEQVTTPQPTLGPILETNQRSTSVTELQTPTVALLTTVTPTHVVGNSTSEASISDDPENYRALMEEARRKHPYPESVDVMWQVMMCESSGNPTIAGPGGLMGLFQYTPETWTGSWNPYRDQPISDARAQIFATAKAWSDGYQHWWQVCLP